MKKLLSLLAFFMPHSGVTEPKESSLDMTFKEPESSRKDRNFMRSMVAHNQGVRKYNINGRIVHARNLKNAERKCRNLASLENDPINIG
jgi:hypothetical protein